eukprot:Rhum_TRINITY_DN14152_c0_g1::Rhum_TRINITY_DN14152_c0_g1_i1::g.70262::m.70262
MHVPPPSLVDPLIFLLFFILGERVCVSGVEGRRCFLCFHPFFLCPFFCSFFVKIFYVFLRCLFLGFFSPLLLCACCVAELKPEVNFLLGQLKQHRVIEVLVDAHILRQPLSPPSLHKVVPGQDRRPRWLQRPQHNVLVQRVTRHDRPLVEARLHERLTPRVRPHVRLEAEAVHGRQAALGHEQRCARLLHLLEDVAAAGADDSLHAAQAVLGADHLEGVPRLHEARCGHEEGGVGHAARGGPDLLRPALHRVGGDVGVHELELDVADLLVAQRTLARSPLVSQDDRILDGVEVLADDLAGDSVVKQHVRTVGVGAERPHRSRRQSVPSVLGLEELPCVLRLVKSDSFALNLVGKSLVQRLRNHRDLVLLVRRLSEALQARRLDDRLAELRHRVGHLDLHLREQPPQVVHDAVQVQLAGAQDDVLTALLDGDLGHGVRLVHLRQTLHHLGQVAGQQRLDRQLDHGGGTEVERLEDGDAFVVARADRRRLLDRAVDALDQHPRACGSLRHLKAVASLRNPKPVRLRDRHVLRVVLRVVLAQHPDLRLGPHRAGHHAPQRVEPGAVLPVQQLRHVHDKRTLRVAREHALRHRVPGHGPRVHPRHPRLGGLRGVRHVRQHHVHEARRVLEEASRHNLQERVGVQLRLVPPQLHADAVGELRAQRLALLRNDDARELVQRLEDEGDERRRVVLVIPLPRELAGLRVVVDAAPQPLREAVHVESAAVEVAVDARERAQREAVVVLRRGEQHVVTLRREARRRAARRVEGCLGDELVDFGQHVADLRVGVDGRDAKLQNEPVDLVQHQHQREPLCQGPEEHLLRGHHHAFDDVHHEHHSVGQTHRRYRLLHQRRVPRRVQHVERELLPLVALEQRRHRRRLHAHAPLLLVEPRVRHAARLVHHVVHERRLAVREVAGDGHVADEGGVLENVREVGVLVRHLAALLLLLREVRAVDLRRDDGLLDGLRILLADDDLSLGAVHLVVVRVVLTVLLENEGPACVDGDVVVLVDVHHVRLLLLLCLLLAAAGRRVAAATLRAVALGRLPDVVAELIVLAVHLFFSLFFGSRKKKKMKKGGFPPFFLVLLFLFVPCSYQ